MKRILSAVLAVLLLFTVTACSGAGGTTTTTVATTTTSATSTTGTTTGTTVIPDDPTTTTVTGQTDSTSSTTPVTTQNGTTTSEAITTVTTVTTATTTTVLQPSATTTKTPTTTTTVRPTVTQPNVTRVISCWGDSITEGMNMNDADRYPKVLNDLLGSNYIVQNSGDGGEDTLTIMARQGAAPVYLEKDVTFASGETRVLISSRVTTGNVTLKLRPQLGRELPINDVIIGNQTYTVTLENYNANLKTYDVYLNRKSGTTALTIPAGTAVKFASVTAAKTNYCDVYLMGANGGWNDDVNVLVSHFQKMIDYRGNDNYIVVIPYWRTDCNAAFKAAFGDKAIDLVDYAKTKGLTALNITPSREDSIAMRQGLLPHCLTLNGTSVKTDVHLSSRGYRMLATAVYDAGCSLGYWS